MSSTAGQSLFGNAHYYEGGGLTASSLNASGLKIAGLYSAPKTGTINAIGCQINSKTGTAPTYEARLESVSSGFPSGSLYGSGTNADITIPGSLAAFLWTTLGTGASVTKGDLLAGVVAYRTGTINGSNFAAFGYVLATRQTMPMSATNNGTSWASGGMGTPLVCLKYSDGTIVQGGAPIVSSAASSFASGASPNERAIKFAMPFTATVGAMMSALRFEATNSTATITLYDGSGNVLDSCSLDGSVDSTASTLSSTYAQFSSNTLTSGSTYSIGIKATGAGNIRLQQLDFPTTTERDYFFGSAFRSTRTGSGAWTDTSTGIEWIVPIVDTVITRATDNFRGGLTR